MDSAKINDALQKFITILPNDFNAMGNVGFYFMMIVFCGSGCGMLTDSF
jgi:hypothetical protein